MDSKESDEQAIRELIRRQFESMTWTAGGSPDLSKFSSDFLPDAPLFPAARPLAAQSIEAFGARMCELARTSLASFHERVLGAQVHVFGSVAIAAVACENTENASQINRNVEMLLLVRDDGRWKIAAQAWDKETERQTIPTRFLDHI